jgi:hypothetical protein
LAQQNLGKWPLGRQRKQQENNIKLDISEIAYEYEVAVDLKTVAVLMRQCF